MNVNICKYSCLSYDFEGTDYLGYEGPEDSGSPAEEDYSGEDQLSSQ